MESQYSFTEDWAEQIIKDGYALFDSDDSTYRRALTGELESAIFEVDRCQEVEPAAIRGVVEALIKVAGNSCADHKETMARALGQLNERFPRMTSQREPKHTVVRIIALLWGGRDEDWGQGLTSHVSDMIHHIKAVTPDNDLWEFMYGDSPKALRIIFQTQVDSLEGRIRQLEKQRDDALSENLKLLAEKRELEDVSSTAMSVIRDERDKAYSLYDSYRALLAIRVKRLDSKLSENEALTAYPDKLEHSGPEQTEQESQSRIRDLERRIAALEAQCREHTS